MYEDIAATDSSKQNPLVGSSKEPENVPWQMPSQLQKCPCS